MPLRQVIEASEGRRYFVTASRVAAARRPLATFLAGASVLPDGDDDHDDWEVRVESAAGERVFAAPSGEIAERLMVLLGEELELGVLEV